MEPSDLEKQLGELEDKIDRVRALYEQYFMGIERLEPLTPRKDVDRKIVGLRKEQMRNTALRFRFNTLCQRFNTMQQHWGRITREIENGTYKRDVARAAARFGVEDALTAVGRKRGQALQRVLEKQGTTDVAKQKTEDEARRKQAELDRPADDYDDEAPTPPPPPGGLRPVRQASVDSSKFAPPPADPNALASYGFGPVPRFAGPAGADPDLAALGFPAPGGAASASPAARPGPPALPHSPRPPTQPGGGFSPPQQAAPASPAHHAPPAPVQVAAAPSVAAPPQPAIEVGTESVARKATGGLRLGGGGRRTADPDAARRRLQELAEKMGASPAGPAEPPAPAPPSRRFAPEDVIAAAVPASVPPPAVSPQRPAAAPAIRPRTGDFAPPSKPLGLRPPSAGRASSPSLEGELGGAQTPPPRNVAAAPVAALPTPHPAPVPVPASAVASTPTAAERADALREGAAHRAARRPDDLGESRVRQIYNELLEAKRRGNESTASITFDKLHDSLKKQVDKLKKEHTDRRIDFAVVTKDGKAMIKPIIK